ncbi:MAG: phage major capsid protein, partial [Methylococcaceae bacterium]|nr:phage major capsid protein [Methylococcaceae bacterium]
MNHQEKLQRRAALYDENVALLAEVDKPETTVERKAEIRSKIAANINEMQGLTKDIESHEANLAAAGIIDAKGKIKPPAEPKDHSKDMPYPEGARGLAEQLHDVYNYYHNGELSERLAQVQAAATGGSSGVPSEGGFFVQPNQSDQLITTAIEQDDVLSKMSSINLGANEDRAERKMVRDRSRKNGFRWGGVVAYRRAEAATVTAFKSDDFKTWECRLEDIMAVTYLTERLAEDVSQLEGMIQSDVPKEIAFKLTDEAFRGTGVGQMLGITKSGSLVSVPIESGQTLANGTIKSENISKMWARVPAANRKNAIWIYNQEMEPYFDSLNM